MGRLSAIKGPLSNIRVSDCPVGHRNAGAQEPRCRADAGHTAAGLASTTDASAAARAGRGETGAAGNRRHGPALPGGQPLRFPVLLAAPARAIPGAGRRTGKTTQRVISNGPFTFGPGAVHDAY